MPPATRLAEYSERWVEAGWLATVVVLPLAFDPLASEAFEPVKSACLRWLACLMVAGMILSAWERRPRMRQGQGGGALLAVPLAGPVLAVLASVVLASICSLQPALSFLGSPARAQGALTALSGAVVFLALVVHLRHGNQWRRLIMALLLTSLPVALYAVMQRVGLDPLAWSQPVQQRAASTLGNPIFLAAYLAMVSFITLAGLLEAKRQRHAGRMLGLGLLLALQSGGVLAAASRGPVLAWAAALLLFALLLVARCSGESTDEAAARRVRVAGWLMLPVLALGVAGLSRMVDLEQGSGRARVLIWEASAQLVLPHAPVVLANGDADPRHAWRPWLGYGPETFPLVFHRVFPPGLAYLDTRTGMPDRAHSETFDALVMTGLLGFAAQQALFLAAFQFGLAMLGLLPTRRLARLCFGVMLSGGVLLVGLAVLWRGPALAGPAWPLGVAAGLLACVVLSLLAPRRSGAVPVAAQGSGAVTAALLAVLLVHYLETGLSGISVPATRSLFWVCLGMLVVLRLRPGLTGTSGVPLAGTTAFARKGGVVLAASLLAGLLWAGHASLGPLRADRLATRAGQQAAERDWSAALHSQQQALLLHPGNDRYHGSLAEYHLRRAASPQDPGGQAALGAAEAALLRARALSPLHPVHSVNLGRLYRYWAAQETTPGQRRQRLSRAADAYGQATRLSPYQAEVWNEWAQVQLQRYRNDLAAGEPANAAAQLTLARRYLGQSLALDGQYDRSFLVSAEIAEAEGNFAAVAAAYQRALFHNPGLAEAWQGLAALHRRAPAIARLEATARQKLDAHPELLAPWRILVTEVYLPVGRLDEAIAAQRRVLALTGEGPGRAFEQLSLALVLAEAGQGREARELAQASLDHLPPERQAEARALIDLLPDW